VCVAALLVPPSTLTSTRATRSQPLPGPSSEPPALGHGVLQLYEIMDTVAAGGYGCDLGSLIDATTAIPGMFVSWSAAGAPRHPAGRSLLGLRSIPVR